MLRNTLIALLIFSMAGVLGACDPEGAGSGLHVDIRGLSNEQAAEDIADVYCRWMAECGAPSISCSGSSEGETYCEGELERPTYAACYAEMQPEIADDFDGLELTTEQEVVVNDCVNHRVQTCISQAELDAYLDAINAGGEAELGEPEPAACDAMAEIFGGTVEPTQSDPMPGG